MNPCTVVRNNAGISYVLLCPVSSHGDVVGQSSFSATCLGSLGWRRRHERQIARRETSRDWPTFPHPAREA